MGGNINAAPKYLIRLSSHCLCLCCYYIIQFWSRFMKICKFQCQDVNVRPPMTAESPEVEATNVRTVNVSETQSWILKAMLPVTLMMMSVHVSTLYCFILLIN